MLLLDAPAGTGVKPNLAKGFCLGAKLAGLKPVGGIGKEGKSLADPLLSLLAPGNVAIGSTDTQATRRWFS